ncbi:hypothetical protein [Marinospirillum alkaliphilum]|uniref:CheW-like domain-containing protein n=1 Tax=Marinospirillum alkaliphilum DSM 21637 TaxID=1122209 RepID=A0A1K1XR17_9GAMM|nr:hypothetical protein [Marinospirillum alkaliphilum]SFX52169.1 hypothetical protein SAMN02745752_01988 [Marinospirillum alkaliphilum DSM 21637]
MISSLAVVVFSHQQHWFGLESSFVRARGLCSLHRRNLPLVPFSALLPEVESDKKPLEPKEWLQLSAAKIGTGAGGDWLLGLAGEVDLLELPASCISILPPLLHERRLFSPIQALALYQGRLITLLNCHELAAMASKIDLDQ